MKARTFLPIVAVLFAAFTLPTQTFAQSTNVRTRNTNQSTKFKSGVFKGSANLIQSNSVTSFIGAGQSNSVLSGADYAVLGGGFGNLINNDYGTVSGGGGNTASGAVATVAGGEGNTASGVFSFIGAGLGNTANSRSATVSGGEANIAGSAASTVGGGEANTANGEGSTVAGGWRNTASGGWATVAGGQTNTAGAIYTAIGGGNANTASGNYATVPGGNLCFATNDGSFVWSGEPFETTSSWGDYTFTVRALGGVRFYTASGTVAGVELASGSGTWSSLSDRNAKENFGDVNTSEVLAKVAAMPIKTWNYKTQADGIRHIGPTAQDFKKAFGVGESDTGITTVDADGVALAAIQGLVEELKERDKAMAVRDKKIDELNAKLKSFEERLSSLPPAP